MNPAMRRLLKAILRAYPAEHDAVRDHLAATDASPALLDALTAFFASAPGPTFPDGDGHGRDVRLAWARADTFHVGPGPGRRDQGIDRDRGQTLRRRLDDDLKSRLIGADEVSPDALARAQEIRRLGQEIIAILERAENARRDAWLAVPHVRETHHGVTLDRVPPSLYPAIAANDAQREEWQRLYALDVPASADFLHAHPFLVLDTRFFDEAFTTQLLRSFADLDAVLDGRLIHGENFRALGLLRERYRGRIDVICIDPPFNTSDEDFVYRNSYTRSAWLTMMRDRLERAYDLLAEDGVLLTAIDDTETAHLRLLLDEVFGPSNHVTTLAVEVNPAGQNLRPNVPARSHEYWHVYARDTSRVRVRPRPLTPAEEAAYTEEDAKGRFLWDNLRRRGGNSRPEDRPNQWFPLFVDLAKGKVSVEPFPGAEEVWPIDPRGERRIWRVSPEGARREIAAGEIGVRRRGGRIEVVKKSRRPAGKKPKTLWKAPAYSATTYGTKLLEQIVATNVFTYPKSLHLVRDLLSAWAGPEATVLDFFAGSGTTAHAVLDLNRRDGGRRKYVLVEVGDHFDTVLRPRLMKVIYCPEWRHRRPLRRDAGTSHVFRYQRLSPFEVP